MANTAWKEFKDHVMEYFGPTLGTEEESALLIIELASGAVRQAYEDGYNEAIKVVNLKYDDE